MQATATILHADLDAFYASVEQLLDPSLRGRPVAVGGGVVLAASYEAKTFGVRGGVPGRQARDLCPQLTFVPGHFKEYQRPSFNRPAPTSEAADGPALSRPVYSRQAAIWPSVKRKTPASIGACG
jgi:hypothetical protein